MLANLSPQFAARRVILASQSPRRLELLRDCVRAVELAIGLTFEVIPSTFEENLPKDRFSTPDLYVLENARCKALEVLDRETTAADSVLIIGCDTVVVNDGVILEKPTDEQHAFDILTRLSGSTHDVYTGVALFTPALGRDHPHIFYEKTTVTFGPLAPSEIRVYIASGEPMDKAGAYGIQGRARCFVSELRGCCNNAIGFPVQRFCRELHQLDGKSQL